MKVLGENKTKTHRCNMNNDTCHLGVSISQKDSIHKLLLMLLIVPVIDKSTGMQAEVTVAFG